MNQTEKDVKGIINKKEADLSEWYTEVIKKAEMADYAPIRGFMIIKPNAYSIWENIQAEFNKILDEKKIRNAYFPLLIPESFFKKEAEHAEGFAPELAYISEKEEGERYAIRPTSETIIYDSYAKWIRSWRDLPLKMNQWCNVLRWEAKQTKPFLRTREFLWQEGHCVFETEEEAEKNIEEIKESYRKIIEEILAIPVLIGEKSEAEKFAGAKKTITIEALMPDGKALQCGTVHNLGQNFAKAFNVKFKGKDEKEHFAWQTSWGFSTRLIGALIMTHGDNKGLILPPKIAKNKIVIVPIFFEKSKKEVLKKAEEINRKLKKFDSFIDAREEYSAGWKFNEWELKGIPIRIEIGPNEIKKDQVIIVRRDKNKKETIKEEELIEKIELILKEIQENLFKKAKESLDSHIVKAESIEELKKELEKRNIVKIYLVNDKKTEMELKEITGGATSRIIEEAKKEGVCIKTGKKTKTIAYFAKSY